MIIKNKVSIVNILQAMLGAGLQAIALKIFVTQANIIPSGFSGITVLIQKLGLTYFGTNLPFAPINLFINIPAAFMALKMIGKKYTITSFLVLMEISLLTDVIPNISLTDDILILCVFGAIINGFGASLVYMSGTSGGGTDFISMSLSSKYHINTFNYVMMFNILLILIQGALFGFSAAFYSIIFQYVNIQVINTRYKHYEKKTLFIITDKADEVSKKIIESTSHSVTKINAEGCFSHEEKDFLYTITTAPEVHKTIRLVKEIDENAFINIIDSKEVSGHFTYLPVDVSENAIK